MEKHVKHAKIQEKCKKYGKLQNGIENTIVLKIGETKNESDFREEKKQIASH